MRGIGSKPVSDAGLRNDRENMSGIACQFPAQITYRDTQEVDGVLILCASPDLVNELTVRPHPAGVTNHNVQKVIFGSRQSDCPPATNTSRRSNSTLRSPAMKASHCMSSKVRRKTARTLATTCPAETGCREIVVGTRFEAGDHFRFLIPHGDHDNRHRCPLPQPPNKICTVRVRQIQFEHDQLSPSLLIFQQRIITGGSEIEAIAGGFERDADDSAHGLSIVHYQYSRFFRMAESEAIVLQRP